MAKKGLLALALAAIVAGGAFARDRPELRFGGGALSDIDRGGVSRDVHNGDFVGREALGFGGWVFGGARFAEFSLGFFGGPAWSVVRHDGGDRGDWERAGSFLSMSVNLLGKFPFECRRGHAFFPMLGVGHNIALAARDLDGNDIFENTGKSAAGELSAFRIKAGVGGDFLLGERMFLRAQVLGFYRFSSRAEREQVSDMDGSAYAFGFGATTRIGVGFRL